MASFRLGWALAGGIAGVLLSAAAWAHGGGNARVRAVLDPLPEALAGVRVELHRTVSPQVVIANETERVVEVLDDEGVPFLRIGRDGAFGNVAARSWYATYGPGLDVPAPAKEESGPRWVRASPEPSFGWFEPRIDGSEVEVPHAWIDAGRGGEVGRFRLPLRVDGRTVSLSGRFQYEPPAKGRWAARLTSPAEIAPGVRVRLLPGGVPGLLVESASDRTLTVFAPGGEPFLRFKESGVEANVQSPAWRGSARGGSGRLGDDERFASEDPASTGAKPVWRRVAEIPRYAWIEPRAAPPEVPASEPAKARRWDVPLQLGNERLRLTGEVAWRDFSESSATRAFPRASRSPVVPAAASAGDSSRP